MLPCSAGAGPSDNCLLVAVSFRMKRQTLKRLFWIGVIVLSPLALYWYWSTDPYRYKVVEATIELVVEGTPVTIRESFACEWHPFAIELGRPYKPMRPVAFAHRLDDGSGIIADLTRGRCDDFPKGYYPSIYWLDDMDRPTHAEFHFWDERRIRQGARVEFVSFHHKTVYGTAFPVFDWFGDTPSIRSEAPWVTRDDPKALWGYFLRIEYLRDVDPVTRAYLRENQSGESVQDFRFLDLPKVGGRYHGLRSLQSRFYRSFPGELCRPHRNHANRCRALRQTSGIPREDTVGVFDGLENRFPFLELKAEKSTGAYKHPVSQGADLSIQGHRFSSERNDLYDTFFLLRDLGAVVFVYKYSLSAKELLSNPFRWQMAL